MRTRIFMSLAALACKAAAIALKPLSGPLIGDSVERRGGVPPSVDNSQLNTCLNPGDTPRNQRIQACKPKNVRNGKGDCGPLTPENGCAAFCQVDVRWDYGPEAPFDDMSCTCADNTCSITQSMSTALTNSYAFNVGINLKKRDGKGLGLSDLTNAFNVGATWSWSHTYTNATAHTNTKPTYAAGKCGQFTFVPYYVTTCGTLTYSDRVYDNFASYRGPPPTDTFMCGKDITTVPSWCQTTPYIGFNGGPVGSTIFVAKNCDGQWPLGFCWQDPIYLNPGVSHNDSIFQNWLDVHQDFDLSKPVESTPKYWCLQGTHGYEPGGDSLPQGCGNHPPSATSPSSLSTR